MVGPLGPAVKTLDFAMKKLFEEDAKKPETQDRRFREKFIRLPLEAAGALGFVPFYGDVRKYVLDEVVYPDLRTGKTSSSRPKAKEIKELRDKLLEGTGYTSETKLKKEDPAAWRKTFGKAKNIIKMKKLKREAAKEKRKAAREERKNN